MLPQMTQAALVRRIAKVADRTESALASLLTDTAHGDEIFRPALLMEAMRYAALGAGKRFRPFLVKETAKLFGKSGAGVIRAGAALEMIHCYSLAHDDLPAMDDDDLRRGKPTVHRAYDEAMAILAGDALLTLAFDVVADRRTDPSPAKRIRLVRILAQASGCGGMVGGQVLDLAADGRYPTLASAGPEVDGVIRIQSMKTGALIAAAADLGAVLGEASPRDHRAVLDYARALGLAFQIKDDLMDVEGEASAVGKATGKDAEAGKATFVSLSGLRGAKAYLAEVTDVARGALLPFKDNAATLLALLDYNIERSS